MSQTAPPAVTPAPARAATPIPAPNAKTAARPAVGATWIGFLLAAFAVVGLVGVFASYAATVPLVRQAAREAALDAALRAAGGPQPQAALERLRPALEDSADPVLQGAGDAPSRIAAERLAMRARFARESDALGSRLRWMIVLTALAAAGFGTAILYAGRGGAGDGGPS